MKRVDVSILSKAQASSKKLSGLVLTLRRSDSKSGTGAVAVRIPQKVLAGYFGADYATRTVWKQTSASGSSVAVPMTMDATTASVVLTPKVSTSTTTVSATSTGVSSTGDGTFAATSVTPSAVRDVSAQTGAFSWNYPMDAPPAAAGPSPDLGISYDSQSVDGETSATNNQSSVVGEGWAVGGAGFIQRQFVPCALDTTSTTSAASKSGDLCWKTDNATLSFAGHSGQLVKTSTPNTWKLSTDDGSRIEHLTGDGGGCTDSSADVDCWRMTTRDGTQYYFGLNKLPGYTSASATPATTSRWTVPVYGDDPGEPGYKTTFASASTKQAWRWNLDYVVDVHGNAEALYYANEGNYYKQNGTTKTRYTRSGVLQRIDYGLTAGNVYGTGAATDRVTFAYNAHGRCTTSCSSEPVADAAVTPATPASYPDVPFDQLCSASNCPTTPTFWTDAVLSSITTSYRSSSKAYTNVDKWTMTHSFPDPGDGSSAALNLKTIQHTGYSGSTSIAEAATTFGSASMQNRVWPTSGAQSTVPGQDGLGPLNKFRLKSITSSTGSVTSVKYSSPDCQPTQVRSIEAGQANDDRLCFVQHWVPSVQWAGKAPYEDVFQTYVVKTVIIDPETGGAYDPAQVTSYDYTGTPGWRYDDSPSTPEKQRSYSDYAGFDTVRVREGSQASTESDTEYTFFQGLDGDRADATGGTKSVTVTGSTTVPDSKWFAGETRETKVLNGVGGSVVSDTVSTPWAGAVEATSSAGSLSARFVGDGTTVVTEPTSTNSTRTVTTTTSHEAAYGLPTAVSTTSPAGDTCETTTYAPANTSAWLIGIPQEVSSVGVACGTTPTLPDDAVSDKRSFFDGSTTFGSTPTTGDVTLSQAVSSYSGSGSDSTPIWSSTSQGTYDALGRSASVTDALGNTTTTVYTPATGGPLTKTVTTNALGQMSTSVVTADRGLQTSSTDTKQLTTTATYDALGRRIRVWLPGHPQASNASTPSTKYTYTMSKGGPVAVRADTLVGGMTDTSFTLYDSLGRQVQTQDESPGPLTARGGFGSIVTDNAYDSLGRVIRVDNAYWVPSTSPSTSLFVPSNIQNLDSVTTTDYDGAGRTKDTILMSLGTEESRTGYAYPGIDEVDTTPPTGGTPTSTFTNAFGLTTKLVQHLAATPGASASTETTTYGYDAARNRTSMTDPSGNRWTWAYDELGRQVKAVDPDTGTTTSTYDLGGELLTSTDGRGTTLSYSYDKAGNKTATYSGTGDDESLLDSWSYNSLGQLTASSSFTGSTPGAPGAEYKTAVNGYDAGGRSTGTTVTIPASAPAFGGTTYTQSMSSSSNDGSLHSITHTAIGTLPADLELFSYDNTGRNDAVGSNGFLAYSSFDGIGELSLMTRDGSTLDITGYGYDPGTRAITQIVDQTGGGSTNDIQASRNYTRDASGNVISAKTTGSAGDEMQCYSYDGLHELTAAWTPASKACNTAPTSATLGGPAPYWESFSYDAATGNRLTSTQHAVGSGSDSVSTYQYPAAGSADPHAVQSVTTAQGGTSSTASYGYDASGNTTSRPGQTLQYDAEGRLSTVTTAAGTQNAIYDADGDLLMQIDPTSGATLFLGDTEAHEKPGSTTITATRTYTLDGVAIDERSTDSGTSVLNLVNADVDGTVDLEVRASTSAVTRRFVDPFGNTRGSAVTWSSDHGFLNQPTSSFSGLTQLGARAYDPALGRFLSVDPVLAPTNPIPSNGYAYSSNDPITVSDVDGQAARP